MAGNAFQDHSKAGGAGGLGEVFYVCIRAFQKYSKYFFLTLHSKHKLATSTLSILEH
jgi:hypothetical protein